MSSKTEIAAAKLRTAFELSDAGVRMQRQCLKRRHPDADEAAPSPTY